MFRKLFLSSVRKFLQSDLVFSTLYFQRIYFFLFLLSLLLLQRVWLFCYVTDRKGRQVSQIRKKRGYLNRVCYTSLYVEQLIFQSHLDVLKCGHSWRRIETSNLSIHVRKKSQLNSIRCNPDRCWNFIQKIKENRYRARLLYRVSHEKPWRKIQCLTSERRRPVGNIRWDERHVNTYARFYRFFDIFKPIFQSNPIGIASCDSVARARLS